MVTTKPLILIKVKWRSNIKVEAQKKKESDSFYGTLEPFASEAIYFAMTDRFVDGDPTNNFPEQGGDYPTYQRPIEGPNGKKSLCWLYGRRL